MKRTTKEEMNQSTLQIPLTNIVSHQDPFSGHMKGSNKSRNAFTKKIGDTTTSGGSKSINHSKVGRAAMFLIQSHSKRGIDAVNSPIGRGPHHLLLLGKILIVCTHAIILGRKHQNNIDSAGRQWPQQQLNQMRVIKSVRLKEQSAAFKLTVWVHHHFSARFGQSAKHNKTCAAMKHFRLTHIMNLARKVTISMKHPD